MANFKLSTVLIVLFSLSSSIYSCQVFIINDGLAGILIIDKNDNKAVAVQKGKTKRIGHPHKLAYCDVYTKKLNAQSYDLRFTIKQNECAKNGKPALKLSDLEQKIDATRLFTITDYQQPTAAHIASAHTIQNRAAHPNHECASCNK